MNIKKSLFKEIATRKSLLVIIGVVILCGLSILFLVGEDVKKLITGFLGVTPPDNVVDFQTKAGDSQVILSWTNPLDSDYYGTKVCYSTTTYPTEPTTCLEACNQVAWPGSGDSCLHLELTNEAIYYYTAFAYDEADNYSLAFPSAQGKATPQALLTNTLSLKFGLEGRKDLSSNLTVYFLDPETETIVYQDEGSSTPSGDFQIDIPRESLPEGIYDLRVTAPNYLSREITNFAWPAEFKIEFEDILAGNLQDVDDIIGQSDQRIMISQWQTADPAADINQDGWVNSLDWHYLNKNWGLMGD